MSDDIFTESCRDRINRSEVLVEKVEQWKVDHTRAMRTYDVEYLIADFIGMSECVLSLARRFSESGDVHGFPTFSDASTGLLSLFEAAIFHGKRVREQATELEGYGYPIARLDDMDARINALEDGMSQAEKTWPRFNPATAEQSRSDFRAGKFKTARELANALRRRCSH
ncbi:MAG: hypothetical protein ACKV0T_25655 [Planctomycetales bacterium]